MQEQATEDPRFTDRCLEHLFRSQRRKAARLITPRTGILKRRRIPEAIWKGIETAAVLENGHATYEIIIFEPAIIRALELSASGYFPRTTMSGLCAWG